VLETFLALLHLSWLTLDKRHDLSRKLKVSGMDLVKSAALQLGATGPIEELLNRRIGGVFEAVGAPAAPPSSGARTGSAAPRSQGGAG
jgi:hypothetical protein